MGEEGTETFKVQRISRRGFLSLGGAGLFSLAMCTHSRAYAKSSDHARFAGSAGAGTEQVSPFDESVSPEGTWNSDDIVAGLLC